MQVTVSPPSTENNDKTHLTVGFIKITDHKRTWRTQPRCADKVVFLFAHIVIPFVVPELQAVLISSRVVWFKSCPCCEYVVSEKTTVGPLPNTLLFFIRPSNPNWQIRPVSLFFLLNQIVIDSLGGDSNESSTLIPAELVSLLPGLLVIGLPPEVAGALLFRPPCWAGACALGLPALLSNI